VSPCAERLSDETLLDWWSGELGPAVARRVERHLLSCGHCSERAGSLAALSDGVQALVREGRLAAVLSPAVVERLRREGKRIREYRVAPGGGVQCTVAPDDDVVLARLGADFAGVTRVDLLRVVDVAGTEQRLADLPFDPAAGELIFSPPADMLRAMPASVERMRLVAVEPGGERLLGEYTFDHTPWPGR
jgi:anti-sigma factor RsiW